MTVSHSKFRSFQSKEADSGVVETLMEYTVSILAEATPPGRKFRTILLVSAYNVTISYMGMMSLDWMTMNKDYSKLKLKARQCGDGITECTNLPRKTEKKKLSPNHLVLRHVTACRIRGMGFIRGPLSVL